MNSVTNVVEELIDYTNKMLAHAIADEWDTVKSLDTERQRLLDNASALSNVATTDEALDEIASLQYRILELAKERRQV